MTKEQFNAWCELKSYLTNKYGSIPIYGHKEVGSSDCPSKYFLQLIIMLHGLKQAIY